MDWEAREYKDFSKAKYAVYQNVEKLVDPSVVKRIDEQGNPTTIKKLTTKQELTMYWQQNSKKSAILILIGAGIPAMILANESNIFNAIFESILNFITAIISLFLG